MAVTVTAGARVQSAVSIGLQAADGSGTVLISRAQRAVERTSLYNNILLKIYAQHRRGDEHHVNCSWWRPGACHMHQSQSSHASHRELCAGGNIMHHFSIGNLKK